jgi:TPR repeat protein
MPKLLLVLLSAPMLGLATLAVGGAWRLNRLEARCHAGDATSCARGADVLLHSPFVRADDARTASMLQRACEESNGHACANLGYLTAYGRAGEGGVPEAVELYAKGCELDSALGCTNLASVLMEGGWGVEADPARAIVALRKACTLGDEEACAADVDDAPQPSPAADPSDTER